MVLSGCDNSGASSDVEAAQASANDQQTENTGDAAANSDRSERPDNRLTDGRSSTNDNQGPSLRDRRDRVNQTQPATDRPDRASETLTVRAEPESLNLGQIPTGDSATGKVRLYNEGAEPVSLTNCRTSCGCTTTNCPRGQTIQPGESVEVDVSLDGGRRATTIRKTVTFQIEGQRPLIVPVEADAVEYVQVKPNYLLDRKESGETQIVFESTDASPLKVTRMSPPVVESFPEQPQQSVALQFSWDRWQELGEPAIINVSLEHPKTTEKQLIVRKTRRRAPATQSANDSDQLRTKGNNIATPSEARLSIELLIKRGQTDELMKRIDEGLDLETRDDQGNTILALAARYGTRDLVASLLEAGANIEGRANNGQTPMMQAAQAKKTEIVKLFIEQGASVNATDQIGNTALSWAAGFGDTEAVSAMIDAGAEVNVSGGVTGWSPLIWAAKLNKPDVVQLLLDAGANLDHKGNLFGATALIHAAQTGEDQNIQILLENGADLEARDRSERTALLMAASQSGARASTVQTLIDAGADLTATDNRGRNALDLARQRTDPRRQQVIDVIAKAMENVDASDDGE